MSCCWFRRSKTFCGVIYSPVATLSWSNRKIQGHVVKLAVHHD